MHLQWKCRVIKQKKRKDNTGGAGDVTVSHTVFLSPRLSLKPNPSAAQGTAQTDTRFALSHLPKE